MSGSEQIEIVACRKCGALVGVDDTTGAIEPDYHEFADSLCFRRRVSECLDLAVQIADELPLFRQ